MSDPFDFNQSGNLQFYARQLAAIIRGFILETVREIEDRHPPADNSQDS